ncbi:MAG: hypothetical protein JW737_07350, partial [Acidobacteria bacterium]|nr:hypothetical protein [Acidobacteriota bacterium]
QILRNKKLKVLNYASVFLLILLFFWNIAITGFQTNTDKLNLLTKQKSIFSIYTEECIGSITDVPVYLIRAPKIFFNPYNSWHSYSIKLHKQSDFIPIESGAQFLNSGWSNISFNNLSSEFYTTCIRDISRINFILDEPEKIRIEFDISAMDDTKIIIPIINNKALNPELLMLRRQSLAVDIEAENLKKGINILQFDSYKKIPFFSETKSESSPGYFFHLYSISYNFSQDKTETE